MTTANSLDMDTEAPDPSLSQPLQALWWLKKGGLKMGPEWTKAHMICQIDEGERDHDRVHALAHWIEGDLGNANWWYRRTGEERAGDIPAEWDRLFADMSD